MLSTQFGAALVNIEPTAADKNNTPLAHDRIREALSEDEIVAGWGFDPVLIAGLRQGRVLAGQ